MMEKSESFFCFMVSVVFTEDLAVQLNTVTQFSHTPTPRIITSLVYCNLISIFRVMIITITRLIILNLVIDCGSGAKLVATAQCSGQTSDLQFDNKIVSQSTHHLSKPFIFSVSINQYLSCYRADVECRYKRETSISVSCIVVL